MYKIADFVVLFHNRDQFCRKILRMRSHKPHAKLSFHIGNRIEQSRKIGIPVPIRVDVLPKKRDLFVSRRNQRTHFLKNAIH